MTYTYFLELGLIILFVKFFSLLTSKFHIPKVLGSLLVGIFLGPAVLDIVHTSSFLDILSKIAIIFIMFLAGMETRLKSFIAGTKKFAIIAIMGILFPLLFGFLFSRLYTNNFIENLIFGAVITSTSVSITIEALIELKKMKTNVGLAILGAGVVDDILGIILLTFVINSSSLTVGTFTIIIAKIFLFFLIAIAFGFLVYSIFSLLGRILQVDDIPVYSIAYALIMAYLAEAFGVSGIIGSYIAGLVIGTTDGAKKAKKHIDSMVELFFSPIFFASIGLNLHSLSFSFETWVFIFGFAAITILSKIIGNGLGAKICGYKKKDALRIGIGMSTRGEVSLIMLEAAAELALIQEESFSIVLVAILLVNLVSPILLNMSFEKNKKEEKLQTT
ncbi:MAG: cation:proton antiporter [Clostridia bacterium]|nr:cation:proton antiporter [Clostridia bacterium]